MTSVVSNSMGVNGQVDGVLGEKQTGAFDCKIELSEDLIDKIKKAYGLTSVVTNLKWVYKLARSTESVQELLEAALVYAGAAGLDDVCLCNEGFKEWLHAHAVRGFAPDRGTKRPLDSDDHESPDDNEDLPSLLYEALACSLLWKKGMEWMEEAEGALDEKAEKARERGTDKGEERAEKYEEIRDECERLRDEMDGLFREGPQEMMKGILNGDDGPVRAVLGDGTFHLDIGTE